MKGRNYILIAWAALAVIAAGCSTASTKVHDHLVGDHTHEINAEDTAAMEYLTENFPTRDQELQVRECVTKRTGFDDFVELPDEADYGPPSLTSDPDEDIPHIPNEVNIAGTDCIFALGLEDRYFPPWDHAVLRANIAEHNR